MEVIFDIIHDVVLETLEIQDERPYILEVIGKWYYDFLISNQEKLTLYLPSHDEKLLNIIQRKGLVLFPQQAKIFFFISQIILSQKASLKLMIK